jgi:uncharacterized membrane protein YtjA (UPF0391 family)
VVISLRRTRRAREKSGMRFGNTWPARRRHSVAGRVLGVWKEDLAATFTVFAASSAFSAVRDAGLTVPEGVLTMKIASLVFLVLAVSAGLFGFGGTSWDEAKVVCGILLGLAAISYLGGRLGRRFGRG